VPNVKSAAKRVRTNKKAELRNRAARSAMRTAIRRADEVIAAGEKDKIAEAGNKAVSAIAKTARKGVIHKKKAARLQSRLRIRANRAIAAKS